jgi:hypothetical protein
MMGIFFFAVVVYGVALMLFIVALILKGEDE